MYSYGPPHIAVQKQDDQHEHTFSNYVRIRAVVQKTCLRRWTIGKSGERGSGISVLPARHDDDDDDDERQNESILENFFHSFKDLLLSNDFFILSVQIYLFFFRKQRKPLKNISSLWLHFNPPPYTYIHIYFNNTCTVSVCFFVFCFILNRNLGLMYLFLFFCPLLFDLLNFLSPIFETESQHPFLLKDGCFSGCQFTTAALFSSKK